MGHEVADGVFRLGTRWVNWFLVKEGGRLTVVDAGLPQYWNELGPALEATGCRLADIDAVLLTHRHYDVLGSAERVRAESGGSAYIHPADAEVASWQEHPRPQLDVVTRVLRPGWLISTAHSLSQGGLGLAPLTEHEALIDGALLDVPGHPKVIATPGHTQGHCAFLLEERGVLFSGDALVTFDATSRSRGPQLSSINADRQRAVDSLNRLAGVQATTLLPGHGPPWRGHVSDAVGLALARLQPAS
jgi:glyoxylase-like metal-dependent hydrolase (beta-lactamase superfamily II)